ncbi:MAG: cell division protein FtsZ [Candidatus Magasanikbacteria bacterium RIFCSPLOWO2_01_FULL_43_20b]|uniref:Cell division protein FtsZ n=1 Tax=Candidatus Magasanikbacteria bacterium RIFCSPLOWO2_12_FULL_43_12 TaxID=1798692 RepID=A0A1F6MR06_9BACT|nr:MAG: cell division protein FtsZ [Candidatus Magasanikbacteria bacterium RIFCSPHIGHO2_02_FULL_44_13]OGH73452.1 MAG: cell division protein FtsZ [Candidatus Magasanikbacteria bacterium RIFCSPLOWO2_01_FULL_43_20b]OGH74072.1 MAG: cell division protein FtsZ [Candidatus Magasanikbacteria bacterium RIFCSPLOWO2_12_FULL_43_12]
MPQVKPAIETLAKIKVIGVGGSGGSAIDRMVKAGMKGVDFVAMNTDVQALHHNSAAHKLHIGKTITRGLGAGMDPDLGKRSAEEAQNEIREVLKETDMVFLTCGLGGGTGSGATPVIAEIAREMGALTVAVVTKPFTFEGPQRMSIANKAHEELVRSVDTIITIPNDRVLQIVDKKTTLMEAFRIIDDVLRQGVQGISEVITVPGEINVDFADVRTIMRDTGTALMGIGTGKGDNRAVEAATAAISSPLLEVSIDGARGILFTVTGGPSLGMQEVTEAAKIITSSTDEDAKVIFGVVIDENMGDEIRITVVATGFDGREKIVARSREREKKEEEHRSLFSGSKPFYSLKKQDTMAIDAEEEKAEEPRRPGFFTKPMFSASSNFSNTKDDDSMLSQPVERLAAPPKKIATAKQDDDADLEIPAFIRRKMGL